MNYKTFRTTFSEVPNEVSLTFLITGCPLGCDGCHSQDAWNNNGYELTNNVLISLLDKYSSFITTVCFLGGEWEKESFMELLKIVKESGLKTCLYTGLSKVHPSIHENLDFIKTGRWIAEKGGLDNPQTNQRFYDLINNKDLTHLFSKDSIGIQNI